MYVCGPTVYDHPHIGHMRGCVVYDVLVRHLREQGLRVTHVRNVTDIDDKIVARAAERGEDIGTLAERYTLSYREAAARLKCVAPTREPRVTQHVPEINAFITQLVERNAAYASNGDVYVLDWNSLGRITKLKRLK